MFFFTQNEQNAAGHVHFSVCNIQVTAVAVRKARQPFYLLHPSFCPLVTLRVLLIGFENVFCQQQQSNT